MEREIKKTLGLDGASKRKRILWIGLLVLGVILSVVTVFYFVDRKREAKAVKYITEKVRKGNLVVTVTATGTLQPRNVVNVGTEVSGTIAEILVDYNDRVKKDQILARLDISKLEAQVAQAKASLELSRANIAKAEAELKKAEEILKQYRDAYELTGGKTPSKTDLIRAEADYRVALATVQNAKAQVERDEASLRFYETELSKAIIRSPINGVVLSRNVEVGQTVAASFQTPVLFQIAEDLTKMFLIVDVDEADIGKVREGQRATFTVDAYPERVFEAEVKEVRFSPKTVQGVVTYETVLSVENPDLALRPGMTATAEVRVKEIRNALLVPGKALRFRPVTTQKKNKTSKRGLVGMLLPQRPRRKPSQTAPKLEEKTSSKVWVLKNNKILPVPVKVGITEGKWTEIKEGALSVGDEVVKDIDVSRRE